MVALWVWLWFCRRAWISRKPGIASNRSYAILLPDCRVSILCSMASGLSALLNWKPANACRKNLDPDTWTRESCVWASATPVVLNRHFDGKDKWERAAESVKDMCGHIGLPRPREVLLHPVSLVEGVPHAREYPQLTRKNGGGRRSHNHAVIVFDEPVRGPVIVGAGRFRGIWVVPPDGWKRGRP